MSYLYAIEITSGEESRGYESKAMFDLFLSLYYRASGGARDSMLPGHSQVNYLANQVNRKSRNTMLLLPCHGPWHSIDSFNVCLDSLGFVMFILYVRVC